MTIAAEWLIPFPGEGKFYRCSHFYSVWDWTLQMDRIEGMRRFSSPLYLRRLLVLLGIGSDPCFPDLGGRHPDGLRAAPDSS